MNLEQLIVREIANDNSISFARFMELALYAPEQGYYEIKERVGRAGDFYTSVSVGNLFGEFLARQFGEWLESLNGDAPLQILECGAHDGRLAADILSALQQSSPHLVSRLRYRILEPSVRHKNWQRETLASFANVEWSGDWPEVEPFYGIIFSNELLDAIPFHRMSWNAADRIWDELRVKWDGHRFVWTTEPFRQELPGLPVIPAELAEVFPHGFQTEVSPAALQWWQTAASKLLGGKLVAIDYGLLAEEFLHPERSRGTARAYSRHHLLDDLLANPGEQDITCHVNFSAVMDAGENAGLVTEFHGTQSSFLARILGKQVHEGKKAWTRHELSQFQTLTHPSHLGAKFKVLVQRTA